MAYFFFPKKFVVGKVMEISFKISEMERKWNGNGMENFMTNQVETNFDGMEWKWNGIEMETFQ